jgi:F-type H+-transporting ATPase subunit gamma
MAGLKELKIRLASVRNTKKITYAMKLVAASKLRRAQMEVQSFRSYCQDLFEILNSVTSYLDSNSETNFSLTEVRPVKNIAVVVFGGSRGLAGGYNSSVNKAIERTIKNLKHQHAEAKITFVPLGSKVADYLKKIKSLIEQNYAIEGDKVSQWPLQEVAKNLIDKFKLGKLDKVVILYTEFFSALSQETQETQVLPIEVAVLDEKKNRLIKKKTSEDARSIELVKGDDKIIEPSPREFIEALFPQIIFAEMYFAALNAVASEHGSRMTAMDAATKNAGELIESLQLSYNKLRQASITAELIDIIGGVEALT